MASDKAALTIGQCGEILHPLEKIGWAARFYALAQGTIETIKTVDRLYG